MSKLFCRDSCEITDTRTNHVYDFTMLGTKKPVEFVNPNDGEVYLIGACGPANDCCDKPPCDTYACKKKDKTNALKDKTLKITEDGVRLEYKEPSS